jgi:competence protein ComGC
MALLKKLKGATLMETLVATAIIVIIFMLASIIMNNLFSRSLKHNTQDIEAFLNELQYQYKNDLLALPYDDTYKSWDIEIEKLLEGNQTKITIEAVNQHTKKSLSTTFYD